PVKTGGTGRELRIGSRVSEGLSSLIACLVPTSWPLTPDGRRMEVFVQQLINGITLGSIYGLIAIGYTMVFGIIGMVNFAHGDVFMVSAFIGLIAYLIITAWLGIASVVGALLIVLVVAMALTSLVNWTIERIAYRPLRGSFRLAPLISAIGMSIFLQNYVQVTQGARLKPIPPLLQGGFTVFETGGVWVAAGSFLTLLLGVALPPLGGVFLL